MAAYSRVMRSVMVTAYGGPEVVTLTETEPPVPGSDDLLIRVVAAAVNPVDIAIRAGYMREYLTPTFPFVLGFDVAGIVDAVGAQVTESRPGDELVGHLLGEGLRSGAFCEYLIAHSACFVRKPGTLSFQQSAAVPHAALTASQALEQLDVRSGETVLIHAAAGGVGSFAVQLARLAGAAVIGTASPGNHDYLRGLGAQPVSYQDNLADQVRQLAPDGVDAILDLVGGDELEQSVPLLHPPGRLASTVDFSVARFGGTMIVGHPDRDRLGQLIAMVAAGELTVHIADLYELADTPAALEQVAQRHVRGKVVITIS